MRIPKTIKIIFFLFIFVIFCIVGSSTINEVIPELENGKVLGVVEAGGAINIEEDNNLPENSNIFHPKKISEDKIEIESRSAVIIDCESGDILAEKEKDKKLPIASITKLATAMIFLENNPGWDSIYEIKKEDLQEGGINHIIAGEKIKVKDLFYLSLVSSDNTAAFAMANSTGLKLENFIAEMNRKAKALGLDNTNFKDPVGLSEKNISTAYEIAKLVNLAFLNKDIKEASLTKNYNFSTEGGKVRTAKTTNWLLNKYPKDGIEILGGKTGSLNAAGFCFTAKFINNDGGCLVSVVLGSKDTFARFSETENLINWAYKNFSWIP